MAFAMDMTFAVFGQDSLAQFHRIRNSMVNQPILRLSHQWKWFILVPIVTIAVEGGPDTLSAIYNDLCVRTPIVLIDVRISALAPLLTLIAYPLPSG